MYEWYNRMLQKFYPMKFKPGYSWSIKKNWKLLLLFRNIFFHTILMCILSLYWLCWELPVAFDGLPLSLTVHEINSTETGQQVPNLFFIQFWSSFFTLLMVYWWAIKQLAKVSKKRYQFWKFSFLQGTLYAENSKTMQMSRIQ